MPDDLTVLRELCGSVYLTSRQKEALRRVIGLVSKGSRGTLNFIAATPEIERQFETALEMSLPEPILGPGDAQ